VALEVHAGASGSHSRSETSRRSAGHFKREAVPAVPIFSSGRSRSQLSRPGEGGGGDVPLRRPLIVSLQYAMALATASSLSRAVPSMTPATLPSACFLDWLFLLRSRRPSGRSSTTLARCSFLASLRRHLLTASPFGVVAAPPCFSGERALFGIPSNEEVDDDVVLVEKAEGEEHGSMPALTSPALNAGDDELFFSTVDALYAAVAVANVAHTAHGNSHADAS
jgi:hypothetical protein